MGGGEESVDLEDVKIDMSGIGEPNGAGGGDSKLDISMNSVIRVEDDSSSILDTSVVSVIKVSDAADDKESCISEQDSVIEVGKEGGVGIVDDENKNLTLSIA